MNLHFGHDEGLLFEIRWATDATEDATSATDAAILARVADVLVWGRLSDDGEIRPVKWFLVDMLEFLSTRWTWIRLEESYPIPLAPAPDGPSQLWTESESRWDRLGLEEAQGEEEAVLAFEDRHDLGRAFAGARLPSLWLMRRGRQMLIDTEQTGVVTRPLDEVLETLEELGEYIVSRLQEVDDPYADDVVQRWRNRERDADTQLRIHTGADDEKLEILRQYFDENSDAPIRLNAISAAARQFGAGVSDDEFRRFAATVSEISRHATPELDTLSQQFERDETWQGYRAFEEGYRLARALRRELLARNVIPDRRSRLDPEALLEAWNVSIREFPLEDPRIDAVAVWGPENGPAVLLNPNGQHAQDSRGRRATLAHEICHLLVDRSKDLPFGEVLNRMLPRSLEARANAFAAELLLPRQIAGHRARRALEDGRPPERMVDNLCRSYGVSREITAWQIRRSPAFDELPRSWKVRLSKMVSNPARY